MSFKEKNITVSMLSFTLVLLFFLIAVLRLIQTDSFTSTNVFRLWGIVIVMAIVVTVFATIATHIVSAIISAIATAIETGEEPSNVEVEDLQDERDKLIDLRGDRIAYTISSIGVFFAMLSYVLGQDALVMFTLLIFVGLLAQIIGDISRFYLYRRGV
jgi:hypothetical protein